MSGWPGGREFSAFQPRHENARFHLGLLEAIFSRSLTSHAQLYFVPTASFNDRRLVQGGLRSDEIPGLPGINAFSLATGLAVDIPRR